jgi:hypothetical protein
MHRDGDSFRAKRGKEDRKAQHEKDPTRDALKIGQMVAIVMNAVPRLKKDHEHRGEVPTKEKQARFKALFT